MKKYNHNEKITLSVLISGLFFGLIFYELAFPLLYKEVLLFFLLGHVISIVGIGMQKRWGYTLSSITLKLFIFVSVGNGLPDRALGVLYGYNYSMQFLVLRLIFTAGFGLVALYLVSNTRDKMQFNQGE
ncbi:MAG: hypothetical protein OEY19_04245 [Gammaproteobacteria bacterium]|nr:hypothetical protein [Gammaproteobacteria bacterium]